MKGLISGKPNHPELHEIRILFRQSWDTIDLLDNYMEESNNQHLKWLASKGVRLYPGAGIKWFMYQGALTPATIAPLFIHVNPEQAHELLKASGALFLRYTSDYADESRPWWYITCDRYERTMLSSKMRNQIKRGYKAYVVKKIDHQWLASHGYPCYYAAFARYRFGSPLSKQDFYNELLYNYRDFFEYWGVFAGNDIVGYGQFIIEGNDVLISTLKFTPTDLKQYSGYAFIDTILEHYINVRKMIVHNGQRAISHDTHIQEFLLKFGFKRLYCKLNIFYQPWLKFMVFTALPFRKILELGSDYHMLRKLTSLIFQEYLHRQCHGLQ